MGWIARKLDSLVGTMVAAIAGVVGTQFLAVIQQYRQRLEGHLAEADLNHRQILSGDAYRALEESTRTRLAEAAAERAAELARALDAIVNADAFARPFAFLRHLEPEIAAATLRSFEPAIPIDVVSIAYGLAGMILGWLAWEIVKLPFALLGFGSARTH
ncbi:MAG: DUF2937 family protein [Rhodospirillales bacterium]|jgi:hypothetical protein|nr:DUF2937 family protein [Rhodospirillales bacterium]MDP6804704.1 DUF2937 family protein [Rhodospirillales bacterium]